MCYESIVAQIKKLDFNNGLSKKEKERLFYSVYIEEIMELVFKGLKSIFVRVFQNENWHNYNVLSFQQLWRNIAGICIGGADEILEEFENEKLKSSKA